MPSVAVREGRRHGLGMPGHREVEMFRDFVTEDHGLPRELLRIGKVLQSHPPHRVKCGHSGATRCEALSSADTLATQ